MGNPFRNLTKFELLLWLGSLVTVTVSYMLMPAGNPLSLAASLIGATALIFIAKGYVLGQILTVVFAVFYGIISYHFRYYGEMITYLGMTLPIAVLSVICWLKHPYKDSAEVAVQRMTKRQITVMLTLTVCVTVLFYAILGALDTANLFFSVMSVTTSFLASYLTFMRSPYYALAYAGNDIILIILWVLASCEDSSYLPMVICFVMFLINDIYGFLNWRRMEKRQNCHTILT